MGEEKEETREEMFNRIIHFSRVWRSAYQLPSYEEMKAEIKKERKERRVGNLLAFAFILGYVVLAVVTITLFQYEYLGETIVGISIVFGVCLGMYYLKLVQWMDEFKKNMKVE